MKSNTFVFLCFLWKAFLSTFVHFLIYKFFQICRDILGFKVKIFIWSFFPDLFLLYSGNSNFNLGILNFKIGSVNKVMIEKPNILTYPKNFSDLKSTILQLPVEKFIRLKALNCLSDCKRGENFAPCSFDVFWIFGYVKYSTFENSSVKKLVD